MTANGQDIKITDLTDWLGRLNVVVLDSDMRSGRLTRNVLTALGINKIIMAREPDEVLHALAEKEVDLLISEWNTKPFDGIEFVRMLRKSELHSPALMLPIIFTTNRNTPSEVAIATNAGVNEFLPKPFNARAMFECILAVVERPRGFVLSEGYVGPDRRRGDSKREEEAKRTWKRVDPVIITREQMRGLEAIDKPYLVMPDYALKNKIIGSPLHMAGLDTILSREQIAKQGEEDYIKRIMGDIAVLRQSLKSILATPGYSSFYVERIVSVCTSIRARAISMNYVLGAKVAAHLSDFCLKHFHRESKYHTLVIEKHIETLTAIFQKKLSGEGGEIGKELFHELVQLVKKYA